MGYKMNRAVIYDGTILTKDNPVPDSVPKAVLEQWVKAKFVYKEKPIKEKK